MTDKLNPIPNGEIREALAKQVREEATKMAKSYSVPGNTGNGAVDGHLAGADHEMIDAHDVYTKGLKHDDFGRVQRGHLRTFVSEINQDGNGDTYAETPFPTTYKGDNAGKAAPLNAPLYGSKEAPAHEDKWKKIPDNDTGEAPNARTWESAISGHTFDLQGADADKVAIPAAPALGSAELTAEIAEVYLAALVRDVPFEKWDADNKVQFAANALNKMDYFKNDGDENTPSGRRRKARIGEGRVAHENLFRGSSPRAQDGPYISQFMLVGNSQRMQPDPKYPNNLNERAVSADGLVQSRAHGVVELQDAEAAGSFSTQISYGTQGIPQGFRPHQEGIDHMTDWATWFDVQNGGNRKEVLDFFLTEEADKFVKADNPDPKDFPPKSRLIATPRDLATYVHFDALYQAYLNACLIMLGNGEDTDAGLPEGKGHPTRDGFATFGGPHILTLVTEVATRALKAVRRQKYNIHLRSRPEALAAAIALAWTGNQSTQPHTGAALSDMAKALEKEKILSTVAAHNMSTNEFWTRHGWAPDFGPLKTENKNALLPMAFPEGSPMHPAYGAGHATVAGACVTILKAFFEMYNAKDTRGTFSIYDIVDKKDTATAKRYPSELFDGAAMLTGPGTSLPTAFVPDPENHYKTLKPYGDAPVALTIEGELNKLAANISIGRNFAGVHYYTDYYESLRMGERIAISILREQMLTYREPVSMRLTTFDGDKMMLIGTGGSKGSDDTPVLIWSEKDNNQISFDEWWLKPLS